MKKIILMTGLALLFAACSNDSETLVDQDKDFAPIHVHVDGFSVAQAEFPGTRAAETVVDYTGVNAVTIAFYQGTTEVEKITQLSDDASTYTTFGDFDCSLPMGTYTMVAVAYKTNGDNPFTLTSATEAAYTGLHAFDTFAATQTVVISNTNAVDIGATLTRLASKLEVISTDGKTADVSNVRMTLSAGGKSFNPSTGLATVNTGFANTVGVSAAVGATSTSGTFMFLATDEQSMNVTIETLDADGKTLFSKTVENVPFKRNRITKLTGSMYTSNAIAGTFKVETAWLSDATVKF